MSSVTLRLRLKREEGSLVRVLGLVRRKRFEVVQLRAELAPEGDYLAVRMTLETAREGSAIAAHIEKLLDASHVEVIEAEETDRELRAARVAS
ncbi:MAG TPA: ACT domain-containing protein [Candidatus Acidoferrales bacterium]|nr:ACT domain-containing protein [Candidatus Acidoferrales bacterium]